ncbi:hypothetical protein ACJX0J_041577, partial [Zea mays]
HCPPGDFIRQIPLATRIPEDAKLESCFDEAASVLEIMVPKRGNEPEQHEVQECYELSSEYKNDQYQARLGREVLQPRHRPRPRVLRLQQLPASTSCDFRGGNVASLRSYLHISGRGPQRRQLCEGAVCSGASTGCAYFPAMSRNVEASLLIEEPPPPEVGEGVDGDEGDVVLVSDEGYDVALHLHGVPSGFVLQDTPNACKMVESVWTLYKIDKFELLKVVMEVVNNLRNIHCKGVADLVTDKVKQHTTS